MPQQREKHLINRRETALLGSARHQRASCTCTAGVVESVPCGRCSEYCFCWVLLRTRASNPKLQGQSAIGTVPRGQPVAAAGGTRRYWPVPCLGLDTPYSSQNVTVDARIDRCLALQTKSRTVVVSVLVQVSTHLRMRLWKRWNLTASMGTPLEAPDARLRLACRQRCCPPVAADHRTMASRCVLVPVHASTHPLPLRPRLEPLRSITPPNSCHETLPPALSCH